MSDEAVTDHRPLAGQDREDVLGQPRLAGQLAQAERGQRRELGRFQDHGVAGGEGGSEAPAGDGHGEVPGHDHAHDPERFLEGDVDAARYRYLAAEQPFRGRRVVVEHVADVARLPPGVADGVAGVDHLEPGELLAVGVHGFGEAAQEAATVGRGDPPPLLERPPGVVDGRVRLLPGGAGDLGHGLRRGRVDDGGGHYRAARATAGRGRRGPADAGRLHQGHEQAVVGRVVLGVPLHAQGEVLARDLDGFHRAVVGETDRLHPLAQPVHGLVVMTAALCLVAPVWSRPGCLA